MMTLSKAIELAAYWHGPQKDKTGEPYIYHPLRVMESVRKDGGVILFGHDIYPIVAVLHDILEDTFCPEKQVRDLGPAIYDAVVALTRAKQELEFPRADENGAKAWGEPLETYREYIHRCKKNPIAKVVKIHDLLDNLDTSRYHRDCPYDRYLWAYEHLAGPLPTYREAVMETVRLLGWLEKREVK